MKDIMRVNLMGKKLLAQRLWQGWDDDYDRQLSTDSVIIELPQGAVECCILSDEKKTNSVYLSNNEHNTGLSFKKGTHCHDTVVVITHASPGGYDQSKLMAKPYLAAGFKVICWSRPGYLRTPLITAKSFTEQTELLATLLDYLWIDKVCLHGLSTGALISYNFAKKYPNRVDSLFLENPASAEIMIKNNIMQSKHVDSILFVTQDNWLVNFIQEYSSVIPDKFSIKGEIYFDEPLLSKALISVFGSEKSIKIIQFLKSIGPSELKDSGFYNDIYEITRSKIEPYTLKPRYFISNSEEFKFEKSYELSVHYIEEYIHSRT